MKVGILGCGGMGRVHARHYAKMDVQLGAFDISASAMEEFAASTSAKTFGNESELFEWADVVDMCIPTHVHFAAAVNCISAGKPILLEKPMCRNLRECAQLIEQSEKRNVPVMPAQVVRYFPEFRKARDLVVQGEIGSPAAIRTRRGGKYPHGGTTWFGEFSKSGGILLDLLIHDFDWLRWTFGEVERVFAQSLTLSERTGIDYALVTLTMRSGAVAHCEGTWADPGGFRTAFEVCGSGGMIEWDSRNVASLRTHLYGSSASESPLAQADDPYFRQLSDFLGAVRDSRPMPVSALDGAMAVSVAEAAIESNRTGRAVAPAAP